MIHELFQRGFLIDELYGQVHFFVLSPRDPRVEIYVVVLDDIVLILDFDMNCLSSAA